MAQRRVQKMLKNNFVDVGIAKKSEKQLNNAQGTQDTSQYSMLGLSGAWRGVAAVFSVTFLGLTIITSQYYGLQFIEAEILAQNFVQDELRVVQGIELLKYDTRLVNNIEDEAEFDAGTYTNGNFEAGEDDLVAVTSVDDYLTIGSYGDTVADTSSNDWWGETSTLQTCSATEFNNGTYSDTQWDAGNTWVELDGTGLTNGTGQYTSEIFDAGSDIAWTDLLWTSSRPTYKELPDNKGIEGVYSAGNVDMTGNVLLLHMNEGSGTIVDNSGEGNNGTYNGAGYSSAGQFNSGLDFDGTDDEITVADDSSLDLTEVTASIWVYADDWSGWRSFFHKNTATASSNDLYFEQSGGVLYNYDTINTGSVVLATGQWQHLVYTADATRERLYVDGQIVADEPSQYTGTVNANTLYIGGSGGGGEQIDGRMDEAALWNRALSSTEVGALYRRGANRLKFQVRSCDDNACAGESFIGPDGTNTTYYTELDNSTVGLPNLTLTNVIDNQYFQYRTDFETDNGTISPELSCVSFNQTVASIWTYRKCFDVDHTNANAANETEYQIYLDMDTSTLIGAGKMNSSGDDLRFVDTDGNALSHFVADDMNTTSTRVWLQMDNIDAGTTEEVCMYYGNNIATNTSSRENVFTYGTQTEIYHVVADTAEATVTDFASYTNNNDVSVNTYTGTLNQYDSAHHPSGAAPTLTQTTAISTTDPINGGYNVNGTDNLVPASFASENFVYRMDRYTNYFSFVSPWCDADVEVRNENNNIVTNGSFTVTQGTHHNLTTSNNATTGIANDSSVMIEVTNNCPILAQHHGSSGGDSFVMAPASTEWYGVGSGRVEIAALYDNTNITLYRSTGTNTTYTLNRGENITVNDSGSHGSDPAHRVVADNLIGVTSLADGDGGEATTFLPIDEMGYKYYVAEDAQYIAIATRENTTTTVDLYHDGTACGVGAPDDTATVTAASSYPGKAYFGSTTSGINIPAGSCIVATDRIFAYYEYSGADDEHNAWNERQNKQFIAQEPTYSVGAEETGTWNVDGTNTWTKRTPVTVSNTTTTNLTEYQILVDLENDVPAIFGQTQSDGGDVRVAGGVGDGTDDVTYALENFDGGASEGSLWVKVPSISATSSTTFYIYYYAPARTCDATEFNNGTYSDTQWDGGNSWVELDATGIANGTGQYTSEIFDAGSSTPWSDLSWISSRPTFKELPDNQNTEVDYAAGDADMTNNELLMHLNESSGAVADTSGNGFTGTPGATTTYGADGQFNDALDFSGGGSGEVVIDDSAHPLNYTDVISYGVWFKADTFRNWAGLLSRMSSWGNGYNLQVGTTQRIACGAGGAYTNSDAMPVENEWYHAMCVYDGTDMRLYVNGELQTDTDAITLTQSASDEINIGEFYTNGSSLDFDGQIDEVSISHEALSANDVMDLYRRGANRLKFQVRSCDDNACAGESFIGPDGTNATYYTEESNNSIDLPNPALTNVIDNQYFQYRTDFETDDGTTSPDLSCVSVGGSVSGLTTTGDYDAIFHTSAQKANYYIVDERAIGETLSIISFADGNSVNDSFSTQTVDEGEIVTVPFGAGISQTNSYSVTGPLHIGFDGDATDAAVPIAYAGKEFVYRVDRGNDVFSFYAPFADASVQIQESSGAGWTTLQTVAITTGSTVTVTQDITNTRVFKIVSDEDILGFHQASDNDSKILYPTHLALEEDSGSYEIYGVGTGSILLGAGSDANVTIYRSDGTSTSTTLNAGNNFAYTESGGGSQGTARGYHIVSDAPIGATSYADSDGAETVTFISQKEFSREYVLSNPTQYMSMVARDANVTCRVYDETGTEITTDATGNMDNIPPQTGGAQALPYPNKIFIGGDDTSDGAFFDEGYHMTCDEPVYAYYEHHLNSAITDETSWLTWPQVRKRAEIEPIVEDIDDVDEQGLFYESGKDSTTTGNDFEAYAEYTFDTSAMVRGEHTYWRDITWEEIVNSRSSINGVEQVTVEVASADPAPTCAAAVYPAYTVIAPTTLSTVDDTSLPYVTNTTNTKQIILPDNFSDHSCVRMRVYLRTGDQAYAPKINSVDVGYYVPTILGDQLNNPIVAVTGATGGASERYRVVKAVTADASLNSSQAFTTYGGSSDESVFIQADLDLFEIPTQTTNSQFAFPPFPGATPVDAATQSPFDSTNDVAVYFTNERTAGAMETMDFIFNVDINSVGGPQISRDFQLQISGL